MPAHLANKQTHTPRPPEMPDYHSTNMSATISDSLPSHTVTPSRMAVQHDKTTNSPSASSQDPAMCRTTLRCAQTWSE